MARRDRSEETVEGNTSGKKQPTVGMDCSSSALRLPAKPVSSDIRPISNALWMGGGSAQCCFKSNSLCSTSCAGPGPHKSELLHDDEVVSAQEPAVGPG